MSRIQARLDTLKQQAKIYPAALWLLAVANLVLFTARGMTIPFLVIFFGDVLGLGDGRVGAGIAASSIAGVVFTLGAAGAIDRFGARPLVIVTILGTAATTVLFPFATTLDRFFAVMIAQGLFTQLYWPSSDTLATALVPVSRVGEMFAMLRVANALGTGAGGLLGGLLAASGTIDEFHLLYITAAAGMASAAILVTLLVRPKATTRRTHERSSSGSWREVMRDRRFVFSQAVMFILLAGLTQFSVSTPPFLHTQIGFGGAAIGSLFTINTVVVVACQIAVARRITGLGRGLTLAFSALFWAVAYGMIGASVWFSALPFAAAVVYTFGEMLFMPTSGVIAVELAPEHLRGRYLAFSSVIWGTAWGLASWAGGTVLSSGRPALLWPGLVVLLVLGALGGWLFDQLGPNRATPAPVTAESD